jgi:outer membrane murein-binding lipoprotein Lpp
MAQQALEERLLLTNKLAGGTRRLATSGKIVLYATVAAVAIVMIGMLIAHQMIGQAQGRVAQLNGRISALHRDIDALKNDERRIDSHWGHVHVTPYAGGNAVWLTSGYELTPLHCKTLACYRIDKVPQ